MLLKFSSEEEQTVKLGDFELLNLPQLDKKV